MSYFKAKMQQIPFQLRFRPKPHWGTYSAPPDILAGFKGAYFLVKGVEEGLGRAKEGEKGSEETCF